MARLRGMRFGGGLLVIGAIALASAWPARADDQYAGVGVARISVSNGTVVLQHTDSADKIAAIVNAPVMPGDYVSTGANSRTEVQLDDTDFIRAGALTQMRFTQLDGGANTVQLAAGTIEMSVLRYPDTHPQVQTPSITIQPLDSGRYRVTVTAAGDTLLTVRSGRANLVTPQGTQTVGAGISVLIAGNASDPRIQNVATLAYDDFDAWNNDRDRFMASALAVTAVAAGSYVNSGIVGLTDLNAYGHWSYAAPYGNVWTPYGQLGGWSPYRFGRWAWQPYCGWTWVAYEPWGWAPYHYGRWFYRPHYGWAWYPGPGFSPYYWQPALVAFFGFGPGAGFGFNFSFGNVAWVPLAPYDPYYPWWQRRFRGSPLVAYNTTNITNITNVTNITRIYRNAGAPNGVNAVRGNDLNHATRYDYLQVHAGDLRSVVLAKGGLPIAPSNGASRYTTAGGDVSSRIPVMSPRFAELPRPTLPTISRAQGSSTQTTAQVPVVNRATAVTHPAGSGDAWSRFGSTNTSSVSAVHTPSPSAGATKATSANVAPAHGVAGSDVWSRFDANSGTKATAVSGTARTSTAINGSTPAVNTVPNTPGTQRYTDPGAFRLPMTPYTQYAPNGSSSSHSLWMTPRAYMPMPSGPSVNFSGGANAGGSGGNNGAPHHQGKTH